MKRGYILHSEERLSDIKPTHYANYQKRDYRLVRIFVEGYDDVPFWRAIFDEYDTDHLKFEISVPPREDLAKGKQVLLDMLPNCGPDALICMDSDFDYLFDGHSDTAKIVNGSPFLFQTYAYATENYLCYPPSLHRICARATKNDTMIFDFEAFMESYSRIIYPVFLWYAFLARSRNERIFTLRDFRSTVRLNYLNVENNGEQSLRWLERQVEKRIRSLEHHNYAMRDDVEHFGKVIAPLGATPENTHLFMQGHTLFENVVLIVLHAACEKLRAMSLERIATGTKQGIALKNELSNYNNSLRNVREVLLDNEHYEDCFLFKKVREDIERYIKKLQ